MDKLNRVFNRQNMPVFVFVQVIDHARQRGGFTRARGASYQYQAARLEGNIGKDGRGVELFQA